MSKSYKIGFENLFTGRTDFVVLSQTEFDDFEEYRSGKKPSEQVLIPKKEITAKNSTVFYEIKEGDYAGFSRNGGRVEPVTPTEYFEYDYTTEPAIFGELWEVEKREPKVGCVPDTIKIKKIKNAFTLTEKLKWWIVELRRVVQKQRMTNLPDPRVTAYSNIISDLKEKINKTV